ncbi:MAG: ACT domain-containing protein [Chloroflexi bacterium]|nr:MAG: ACT domain-containing protein [Chloroflexota bacterium]
MAKILVADPLAEDGLERLRQAGEVTVVSKLAEAELIRRIPEFDALVVRSETRVTAPVIEAGTKLRVVGRAGVGVDNIDVSAATRKGILVVNAPRGNIIAAAEHTIALLFSLARWVPQADASVKRGEWSRAKFIGTEIRGKTLGVIGLGNVGSEVAKRAHGLEMDVIAYDPVVAVERAELFNVALVSLHELLERADFVTLHVPLVDSNRNLLGAAELALMKPTARLVNTARGGIVDETALCAALQSGRLAAAAADVFEQEPPGENPLLALPNFVATPHIGASTAEAQVSVAFDVAEEVAAVLAGDLPRFAVNAPALPPEELAYLRGAAELALMKPTARLVNTARGGIVDETALCAALQSGRLAAAAADVFEQEPPGENPLLALPNFVATPHIGASTAEAQVSVAFDVAEEVAAVLAGDLPRFAVNAPALPPEELAYLRPFAELTERLAALHAQLFEGRVSVIELDCEGELAEHDVNLLVAAAITGLLQPFTEERINAVNARLIANNRGIKLVERRSRSHSSYASLVTVRMQGHEIAGTLLMGEPRAVRIDSFRVDLVPEGRFLVSRHEDRPGVVGRVGSILGEHDVNIASMQVGRDAPRGNAMMILAVDDRVAPEVLSRLREVGGMSDLRYVELGTGSDG